jgi:hypothetical protein
MQSVRDQGSVRLKRVLTFVRRSPGNNQFAEVHHPQWSHQLYVQNLVLLLKLKGLRVVYINLWADDEFREGLVSKCSDSNFSEQ